MQLGRGDGVAALIRAAGTLRFESAAFYLLALLAVSAIGLQTAVLRDVAGAPVRTTFVTGMLTHLAEDTVAWLRARGASDTATVDAARTRVGLHGGIWGTYLAGAVADGFAERHWHFWALLVPVLVVRVWPLRSRARHARGSSFSGAARPAQVLDEPDGRETRD